MNELRLLQIVNYVAAVWIALTWVNISRSGMSTVEAKLKPESVAARALECLPAASRAKRQRTKKGPRTKTPDDCPHCCESATANTKVSSNNVTQVVPYPQLKSKRGRPKRRLTEGYCCHNPSVTIAGFATVGFMRWSRMVINRLARDSLNKSNVSGVAANFWSPVTRRCIAAN